MFYQSGLLFWPEDLDEAVYESPSWDLPGWKRKPRIANRKKNGCCEKRRRQH